MPNYLTLKLMLIAEDCMFPLSRKTENEYIPEHKPLEIWGSLHNRNHHEGEKDIHPMIMPAAVHSNC